MRRLLLHASGALAVLLSAGTAPAQSVLSSVHGRLDEGGFAHAFAGAGDLDGDGFDDWIASAPFHTSSRRRLGSVRAFSGRTGAELFSLSGESYSAGDASIEVDFGVAVGGGGDNNGDGYMDVVVMSREEPGSVGVGRVFSGRDGALLQVLRSVQLDDGFGTSCGFLGDLTEDLKDEVFVVSPRWEHQDRAVGGVSIFRSRGGALLRTLVGRQPGEGFGSGVFAMGDVDGDRAGDILVTAPDHGPEHQGEARLFSGQTGGILRSWLGGPGERLGSAAAAGVDLSGDGVADLALLASDPATAELGLRLFSGADGANLGSFTLGATGQTPSLALLANAFGEGQGGIAVARCEREENGSLRGSVELYGVDGERKWTWRTHGCGKPLGGAVAVASAGDGNGDGQDELLVGSRAHGHPAPLSSSGEVHVLSLLGAGEVPDFDRRWREENGVLQVVDPSGSGVVQRKDGFGSIVCATGEVNGDGSADFAVGPWATATDYEALILYSGRDGAELRRSLANRVLDAGPAGDVGGEEGVELLVIGSGDNSVGGELRVETARSGLLVEAQPHTFTWAEGVWQVAVAGDADLDARPDYLVAFPGTVRSVAQGVPFSVELISGRDATQLHRFSVESRLDGYGSALAGVGDLDGDSASDILIGAPSTDLIGRSSTTGRGAVFVHSGRTGALLSKLVGRAEGDALGSALAALGDLDGDGKSEFLVGAPGSEQRGMALVYRGKDFEPIFQIEGMRQQERFGSALAPAGDLNGDGKAEILVGAPGGNGACEGRVYLFSGSDFSLLRVLNDWPGVRIPGAFGAALCSVGDVNGDSIPDALIGSPLRAGKVDHGSAYVFSGAGIAR